jgi:hypothetical protein
MHCVGLSLQIAADEIRFHYIRTTLRVHRYLGVTLAMCHGSSKLALYDTKCLPVKVVEVQRLHT